MTIELPSPASTAAPRDDPQNELAERVSSEVRRLFIRAWLLIVVLVVGVGLWAGLSSISGAVVAAGTVAVDGKRKVVQHLDGGTIARIHVRDGQEIAEGAVLLTLESKELEAELASLEREFEARDRQVSLIENELVGLLELQAKRLVPNSRVTALQRDAAGVAADLARLSAQKDKVRAKLARMEIHAPVAGWVHNLVTHTVGGVIPAGATIAEVVPSGGKLVLETRISTVDIDQIRQGQSASVRMTSFNQRSTPSIEGKVEQVSADAIRDDPKLAPYYLARVSLSADALRRLGQPLVPGMPADVMIETGRRSVITYLTKPLADQIARAFRED